MTMFRILTFIFGLMTVAPAMAAGPQAIPLHETSRPVQEISFADEHGSPLSLGSWRGKFVLLNIWATWCMPCREEMPTLDRLQAKLGGNDFEVVALSIDRAGPVAVRKFYDEIGMMHLPIFIDETMRVARNLGVFGLPGTLLIGPDGKELGRLIGPAEWDTPNMVAIFESIIAEYPKGKTNGTE